MLIQTTITRTEDDSRPLPRGRVLINGFGASFGGIVRVHNAVCVEFARRGFALDVASAPADQVADLPRILIVTAQSESRAGSFVSDAWEGLRSRPRYRLRVDSAPAFRFFTRADTQIVVVHDLNFVDRRIHGISWKQYAYRWLLHQWTLRRADVVVVNSASTGAEVQRFLPCAGVKVRVLPLPVDSIYKVDQGRQAPRDPSMLLSFGHAGNKGVDRLLHAMAEDQSLSLRVIAPMDAWKRFWQKLAADLGVADRVTVLSGLRDIEVRDEYRAAGVFCMLSNYEGYGLPAAEALCCQAPTVISDLAVLRATTAGYAVVAPAHEESILGALKEAGDAPGERWAEAAGVIGAQDWSAWIDSMLLGIA